MKKAVTFTPTYRLSARVRTAGGIPVQQALSQAAARLESVREQCVGALDEKIDAAAALAAETPAPRAPLYAEASEIYGLAATFGLKELAEASRSLCNLLVAGAEPEAASAESAKFAESVEVHIAALRTLRRPELVGDNAGRAAVVDGLRRVVLRTSAGRAD